MRSSATQAEGPGLWDLQLSGLWSRRTDLRALGLDPKAGRRGPGTSPRVAQPVPWEHIPWYPLLQTSSRFVLPYLLTNVTAQLSISLSSKRSISEA